MSDLAIGPFQDPQRDARRQERFAQWEAQEKQRDATLLASFRVASQEDPELVGEARRTAGKLGIAPELAESNIEVARQVVKERALQMMALQRNNPVLMEQLGRTKFVRVAHDDLDNLRSTESTWELMARNWEKGQLANELGYIGLRQALGRATPEEIQRADDIDVMIGRQLPGDDGVAAATSEVLGQMSGTLPLSLAAGAGASQLASLGGPISGGAAFALASGATTFSLTGAISAGQSYRSMIRRGIPHERAAVFAFGAGALEGGLETLGQTIALGPIKGLVKGLSKGAAKTLAGDEAKNVFWQFVKDYATTLGGEVGTELAQTLSTSLVEDAAASGVEGAKEGEDLGEAMWQTFVKTSKAMAVLSAPGPGLRLMSDLAGAERTQAAMQALNQIEQQAAESKVATRDPETYSETVTAMKERQTGDGSVYVNAVAALEGFRQGDKSEADAGKLARPLIEQAEEAMPGFAARLQEAAARGDDVAIPAGDWAGKLSGTKAGEALKPHVRADVNGLSPMEAKPYLDDPEGAAKEAEKLADDEIKKAEKWDDEAREIERTVAEQVVAAGRNRGDAARGAKLWRYAIEVFAEKAGMSPKEVWAKFGIAVRSGEVDAGSLAQGAKTDSPEFKAWFGDSKVVDEQGKPLVVYHGSKSRTAFDEFDIERSGRTDEGWLGRGLYFTTNRYTANAYGDVSAREPLSDDGAWSVTKDRRGMVGSFYLAMRNPLVLKPEGQGWIKQAVIRKALGLPRSASPAEVSSALQAAGHDGVVLDYSATGGLGDERELMVLRPEQIKSVNNRGTFDPNDPNILRQDGARGGFSPLDRVITLTKDADFSTFAHETAHAFLSMLEDAAAQKLHPSLVDDFRSFLKWAGEDEAAWQGKTLDQKRKAHENFAANFESYLFDGKAPEPGLRRLFQAFTRFIKRVYGALVRQKLNEAHRAEFGEDLLPLSDDIRGVMDRMLASDEKVRTTQAIRGAVPLFQTVEEAVAAGMPADRWIELQRQQQEADDSAASDIERASLRDTKWLRIRIGKLKGEKAQQAKRIREGVRQKVAAEVQAKPVYRAMRWLKTGELVNADGTKTQTDGPHKLNRKTVGEILAPGVTEDDLLATEMLPDDASVQSLATAPPAKKMKAMRAYIAHDGMSPDIAAAALGFGDSGKAMVEQIVAAEPIENVIERETDAAMLRDYAELADPARVDAAIEKALHNLARQRFVASELRELTKVGEPLRVLVGAAKLQAEAALAKKPLRDLNPRSFTMAARRASRQAQEAMAAKDVREAIAAKRRHLLQEAMADVAAGIPDEVRKGTASLKQFEKADADLGKKRSIDYVYAGRALAAAYRMRPAPVKGSQEADLIARGLETVKGENPALWERLQPLLAAAERAPIDPKNITLGDFREIVEVSEWLWDAGKAAMELNAEGKRVAMEQAVGDLGGEIAARGPRTAPGASAPEGETATGVGKALLKVWNLFAGLKRMEHWARFMDGGKEGAFHRLFVAPVARALSVYRARQRELVEHYHGILTKAMQASGELWNARIEAKELGFTFKGKKELLGALLHAGSESNLAKLLRGRKGKDGRAWGEMVADGDAETLDTSRWDRTVAGFWKDGTLTKADAEFLTEAWGIYAKLLPQAQKTHKALYGHEFEAIEHRAMDTPHGRLAGGYVPARIDRDAVPPDNRRTADSIAGAEADFRYSISTGKGFTIKRNPNYNQALDLDVGRQLAHFDQELRFIFLQPVVNDAVRITKNRDFRAAIEAYDREAIASIIEPWLENVALQTTSRPSGMPFIDWGATVLRNAASIASLGFNVANSLVQITGISNALSQVRGDYMRSALGTWTKNPVEAKRVAEAKSPYMAQRSDVQVRIWREQIDRATAPGVGKALRQTLSRWAFAPQRFVQGVADVVTWHGGYAQAVAEGKTEQAAIESADSAVRRSQGSQNAEDVAKYESSTPFVKLFTQFGSYSNLVLNQVIGAQGFGGKASAAAWAILLPAIAEATMRLAWTGAPEDKDANGTVDEWFAHYLRGVGRNVAGLIPAGGPMLLSLATTEGERTLEAPGTAIIRQFVSGLFATAEFFAEGGDETSAAEARDIATMLSAATGLPLAAPVRTAQQLTGATR